MLRYGLTLCALSIAAVMPARAEVVRNDADGFTITLRAHSRSEPAIVWQRMIAPAAWWSPDHSWSGDAANISIEPRAGGCWCEAVAGNGSVRHGQVIAFEPARWRLLMRAELGPLQMMPVNGWMEWRVEATASGGSAVSWRYSVTGRGADPASWGPDSGLAAAVDAVLAEQISRLVAAP